MPNSKAMLNVGGICQKLVSSFLTTHQHILCYLGPYDRVKDEIKE